MISPQGYKLGEEPKSKNPFWGEGEDESVNRIYATASVDDETGVPGVVVTKNINGRDITFNFQFHNLKGKEGEQGKTGNTGATGQPGQDGFSPEIICTPIPEGYHIRIIDETGEQEITIADGKDGTDGFSPSAKVEQTANGANITITDKEGTTTASVENGLQGEVGPAGPGVPPGGTVGQVVVKTGSSDYETGWADQTGGGGTQQVVKWVETDYTADVANTFPMHAYGGYNINETSAVGTILNPVTGEMDNIEYTITFNNNVILTIPETFQYFSDDVILARGLGLGIDHSEITYAYLNIPSNDDIIITAQGHPEVKAQGDRYLDCVVEDGSTVYIEGTINTDAGSFIRINKTPLFYFRSDFVSKHEVLKTIQE